MAQVRWQTCDTSPPHRQIPSVPDPLYFRSSPLRNIQETQSFSVNDRPRYIGSPIRATHQQQTFNRSQPPPQTGVFYNSTIRKYDPLTGLSINPSTTTTTTTTNYNNSNENYEHSCHISSPLNHITQWERQRPRPSSEDVYLLQQQQQPQQYERLKLNNNETEEAVTIPTVGDDDDDDGLPVVTIDKGHLPIFARFPFDVTFLPQSMDTNVEDNIHKLRLRLIDSELNHQRRSTDDYIKRTQEQLSLVSPKPTEHYAHNVRPPTNLTYQRVTPKILSRQASDSPLLTQTPTTGSHFSGVSIDRVGLESNPNNNLDLERELELRRVQESLQNGRQSNQQLMISNYVYDPRLHMQPLNEEQQYSSSNMDDLIDSMARRHLAYRRLDAAIDRQRRSAGGYASYFESSIIGRRTSLRSQQRNDDLFFTNASPTKLTEHDFIRTRGDYYNRIQPDFNELRMSTIMRTNSYSILPPITPVIDSSRSQNPSNAALYHVKQNPQGHQNFQKPVPLTVPDHTEHLIELPSDIFLTQRAEPIGSSQHHHQTRKAKARPISIDKSDVSPDSESDRSDNENNPSNHQRNRHKQKPKRNSENGHHGFFTEGTLQQPQKKNKSFRRVFRKAAIGIYFINTLKHRAAKSRLHRPSQTLSATIHKIRLQEIMVALHRVYLEPDGPIYNALVQTITSSVELKDALNSSSRYYSDAINVIGEALKSVISSIVDFMPKDGVLGTAKSSAIAALIQDGNPFPENYFWQSEKELLEFDKSKIINVTKQRAILLLIGIFIFRALVTTLLIKPIKYRLMLGELTHIQTASLKVLASVMLYVGRRAVKSTPQPLTLPHEWNVALYSDADIEPIIQHSEIKSIITTCELSLRVWCEEYIRRIDASFGKELRT